MLVWLFFSFGFMASTIYIINDIEDIEYDKEHPVKKKRPLASGEISMRRGKFLAIILFVLSISMCLFFSNKKLDSLIVLLCYFLLNMLYSRGLKNTPIIDVAILSAGFLLRVIYGSVFMDIVISDWLYLTVISMSFFLGLGKRRNELQRTAENTRKVLSFYNYAFLDKNMYMCLALTIAFYSLWCTDPITINHIGNLTFTVPLVILICMKYSLDIEGDSDGDPVNVVLNDPIIIFSCIILAFFMLAVIYF